MKLDKFFLSIVCIFFMLKETNCQSKYPLSDQINKSTVKIDLIDNGKNIGSASGFVLAFNISDSIDVPCLISNKHVLQAVDTVLLTFNGEIISQTPLDSIIIRTIVDLNLYNAIPHPSSDIDLAALPLNPIAYQLGKQNFTIDFTIVGENLIPTIEDLNKFKVVNDVLIVGYPIGISDTTHNSPIFRKGITSTDPSVMYNGRNEFLIDAAIFPGSSGSPVFIVGSEIQRKPNVIGFAETVYLVGILYGGLEYTVQGEVKPVQIPNKFEIKSLTNIPIDLGVVINSRELFKIKDEISFIIKNIK